MNARIFLLVSALFALTTCRSVKETKALQECSFSFHSITDVTVNGVSLQGRNSMRDLQTQESARISQAIMSRRIPVNLVTHIQIHNPNNETAALNKLDWKFSLKNSQLAQGSIDENYEILPHESLIIPILVQTDIGSVMSSMSVRDLTTLMFSLSSVRTFTEDMELKIRPSIRVGRANIKAPAYIKVDVL